MLDDVTFITALQIESQDRLRNCITVFSYLLKNFPKSKIFVKEIDEESKFLKYALPEIQKNTGNIKNINHFFTKSFDLFNKCENLNDLVIKSDTSIIWNYDVDVLLPISTYRKTYDMIKNEKYDIVYPYGCGVYQWNVLNFNNIYEKFNLGDITTSELIPYSQRLPSVQGFTQAFTKKVFVEGFGLNENFIFVGYEDTEFLYRMQLLNYKIGRVNDDVFHLDHVRTHNKNYSDAEFFEKNIMLWEWIRNQDKETLLKYYKKQFYINKFK